MFSKPKTKKIYEEVIIQVKKNIENEELKYGDPLPSEEVLSKQMGIGRTSVREGLRVLEILGYVKTERGKGTIVIYKTNSKLKSDIAHLVNESNNNSYEVNQINRFLYPMIAKNIAESAKDKEKKKLRDLLITMKVDLDKGRFSEEYLSDFVKLLVSLTENSLLIQLVQSINDVDVYNRILIVNTPNVAKQIYAEYERIVSAIEENNGEKAFEYTVDHFQNVKKLL